jgi:hypothetical protein
MFYAYILQSLAKPDETYRGHTTDLRQRLNDHNSGKCAHTSKFTPWKQKSLSSAESVRVTCAIVPDPKARWHSSLCQNFLSDNDAFSKSLVFTGL